MPRPTYVYLAQMMNYRSAEQWHIIAADGNPLQHAKRRLPHPIETYATHDVLWVVECPQAPALAQAINEWLISLGVEMTGGCFKCEGITSDQIKAKAKEMAKNFAA